MKGSIEIFGHKPPYRNSKLILLAVPWSVTVSFKEGTQRGPEIIAKASSQMDFFSLETKNVLPQGIYYKSPPQFLTSLNQKMREKARPVIALEEKAPGDFSQTLLDEINEACSQMVQWVYGETKNIHQDGKLFGLVGGDHSTSQGSLQYFGELYKSDFGILHIDAHADLRKSYQGFHHSHASIMHNVIHQTYPPVKLVQVGVRDYCEEEYASIQSHKNIHVFFDSKTKAQMFEGKKWRDIVDAIIQLLPQKVYISLDVDGLQPHLFPHTGTPVPGGLSFEQTNYLFDCLLKSKRQIIGFDLVETAGPKGKGSGEDLWDAQVGARLLYKLCQIHILQESERT